MGTNPRYIGNDAEKHAQRVDHLGGRIGYKAASLTFDKQDNIRLQPPHYSDVTFGLSDDSRCERGKAHGDLVRCSCGFYAYNNLESAIQHWTTQTTRGANEIILEVALSGEVVVAERGYRATHQRVQRMFLPHCFKCSSRGEVFAYHVQGFLVPSCRKCAGPSGRVIEFADFAKKYSPEGFKPIEIVPSQHFSREISLFRSDAELFNEVQLLLDRFGAAGKVEVLEQVMSYTAQKLDAAFGLGATAGDE